MRMTQAPGPGHGRHSRGGGKCCHVFITPPSHSAHIRWWMTISTVIIYVLGRPFRTLIRPQPAQVQTLLYTAWLLLSSFISQLRLISTSRPKNYAQQKLLVTVVWCRTLVWLLYLTRPYLKTTAGQVMLLCSTYYVQHALSNDNKLTCNMFFYCQTHKHASREHEAETSIAEEM